jgi:hypothetical protein
MRLADSVIQTQLCPSESADEEAPLASPRSFRLGAKRACAIAGAALSSVADPGYARMPVMPSAAVVGDSTSRGAVFDDELDKVPASLPHGNAVRFSADGPHGDLFRLIDAPAYLIDGSDGIGQFWPPNDSKTLPAKQPTRRADDVGQRIKEMVTSTGRPHTSGHVTVKNRPWPSMLWGDVFGTQRTRNA